MLFLLSHLMTSTRKFFLRVLKKLYLYSMFSTQCITILFHISKIFFSSFCSIGWNHTMASYKSIIFTIMLGERRDLFFNESKNNNWQTKVNRFVKNNVETKSVELFYYFWVLFVILKCHILPRTTCKDIGNAK